MPSSHSGVVLLLLAAVGLGCATAPPSGDGSGPSGGTLSASPPAGLDPSRVPQFVVLGFDDNGISGLPGSGTTGGMRFSVELLEGRRNPAGSGNAATFDGSPALASFYLTTRYIAGTFVDAPEHVKRSWRAAAEAGHEIAIHTHDHDHGERFDRARWAEQIAACVDWLGRPFDDARAGDPAVGIGVDPRRIVGFRAPFLEYGPPLFPALRERGVAYDCSVEVGFEDGLDGTDYPWPFRVAPGYGGRGPRAAAELWELPVYALIVPPDEEAARYGVEPGLRARLHQVHDWFDPADGKITGFDWNVWVSFRMTAPEVLATLRYTLDRRLAGNRAPLTFGTHSDLYSEQYPEQLATTAEERRRALEAFLDDALARPDVRVVSARQLLAWLRAPRPL